MSPNTDDDAAEDQEPGEITNKLCLRLAHVDTYMQVIDTCNNNTLSNILKLYGETPTDSDTVPDKKRRVSDLLKSNGITPPKDVITIIVKKLTIAVVRSELTALKQSHTGTVSVCKERLINCLSSD